MESKQPEDLSEEAEQALRSSDRIKLKVSIAYSQEIGSPSERRKPTTFRWGTLVDIGEHGICFRAPDTFVQDRVISLQLKLSDQTSGIRMLGKVVWARTESDGNSLVGLRFIGTLPSDWRQKISQDQLATPNPAC